MNIIELLASIRNSFEKVNPKVLIPKNFSKQKQTVLEAAINDVRINQSSDSLLNLTKIWVRMMASSDNEAYDRCVKSLSKDTSLPIALRRRLQVLPGEGQLRFSVQSPAGPSRLCRVPFYPLRDENAWSTRFLNIDSSTPSRQPFGIDTLGDDPVVAIGPFLGNQNSNKISSIQMKTQKVEFGSYRLIGMEINANFGSRYIGAVDEGDDAIGSIEVLGVPAPGVGAIELVGPAALAASGELEIVGAGAAATGSVEFTVNEKYATGDITVNGDGTAGFIETRILGGGLEASAVIHIAGASQGGENYITFLNDGQRASGYIQIASGINLSAGNSIQIQNTGLGTGIAQVIELYQAVVGAPGAPFEFTIGINAAATMANFAARVTLNSAVFSAVSGSVPGSERATITQDEPGTHGNGARGANISNGGFISAILQFAGGTDAFDSGAVIEVIDLTGATNTYTAVLSGSGAGAGQFETFGDNDTTGTNAFNAINGTLAFCTVTYIPGGRIEILFNPGYLPDPFCSSTSVTTPVVINSGANGLSVGLDDLDFNSEIEFEIGTGVFVTFAPQPNGTTVPPAAGRIAFQTFANLGATGTSLETAINGAGLPIVAAHAGGGLVTVSYAIQGRYANGRSVAYQTIGGIPFNDTLGPRSLTAVPNIFTTFDTSFSGGTSPVALGTTLTLVDFDGNSYVFTATDGVTDANNFDSSFDLAGTAITFGNMLTAFGTFPAVVVDNSDPDWITYRIDLDEPGVYTGTRQALVNTTDITLSNDAVTFVQFSEDYAQGTNSVTAGQEVRITDTLGVSTIIEFVNASPVGDQVLSAGTAIETASNLATFVNGLSGFSAVSIGSLVNMAQLVAGTLGNTVIIENPVTAELNTTNFNGGTESYGIGDTVELIDTDGTVFTYTSAATNGVGTGTDFRAYSQAEAASNLADRVNAQLPLTITASAVGSTVTVTQVIPGLSGNTVITASNPFVVTLLNFTGGADLVTPGTTVTVEDTTGAIQVFTAVVTPILNTQFASGGAASDIATSLSNTVDIFPGLNVSSAAIGSDVTITQGSVGTIGNGRTLTTSVPAEIAVTTAFSGGIDNVSAGTTVTLEDSFGVVQAFTAIIGGAPVADEFLVDNVDPNTTAINLSAAITAFGFDVTAASVGTTITATQGTNGPNGNTTITTSTPAEFTVSGFTGGTYSVELGSVITLESTDGTVATFTAVDTGINTATQYDVAPATSDTINNLLASIALSPIVGKITGVNNDPIVTLAQVVPGVGGNNPITVTNDPANTLLALGFFAGTDTTLNLENPLSPIVITVKELTVYNGNNILIVEDSESVSVSEFNILDESQGLSLSYELDGSSITPVGQTAQPMSNESEDRTYKFIGFRDQPVVDPNSQVFIKIDSFIGSLPVWDTNGGATPYPADTPLPKIPPVSLSINLVVDLLEDKVFGDISSPSPASRAAANIKLSAKDVGGNRIVLENNTTKKGYE